MDISENINGKLSIAKSAIILKYAIETGSYTKTAEKLGMKQPNISAAIRSLEQILGGRLFTPTPHGVIPTEAALQFNDQVNRFSAALNNLCRYSLDNHKYSGLIKIWMTDGLGMLSISERIHDFCDSYPDVELEIHCSNETPDIGARKADIAIVFREPVHPDSVVIAKHNVKFGLFASEPYLYKHGHPKDLNDLENNHYICDRKEYKSEWPEWNNLLKHAKKISAKSNSTSVLMQLNRLGLGICLQPISSARISKNMIRVLPSFSLEHPYWLITHVDAVNTPKIRAMLDYLKEIMGSL